MNIKIGDKIERWTVLERISRNSRAYYLCECECGTKKEVRADHLKAGKSKSCGCLQKEIVSKNGVIDLTGQQFGEWKVLQRGEKPNTNNQRGVFWLCQCSCGMIKSVSGHTLRNGTSQSCGCVKSRGEEKISKILAENNVTFSRQFSFNNCRSKNDNLLYFDFIVYKENGGLLVIEYQGGQHYGDVPEHWQSPEENDNIKRAFCKEKNIKMVEIPYWDFEKIDWNYLKEKCSL